MYNRVREVVRSVPVFMRDERGTISTEWAIAVTIVVSMAVPVMALISDGSEQNSQDIIVSIQDTDSFGGNGLHPGDGQQAATMEADELFVPGSNLGIGYGTEEHSAELAMTVMEEEIERPRYFDRAATVSSGTGRGGSGLSRRRGGGSGGNGGDAPVTGPAELPPPVVQSDPVPDTGTDQLPLNTEHCFEPNAQPYQPQLANYVVASGR